MKNILILCFTFLASHVMSQTKTMKIEKELTFEKQHPDNALLIANINGSIIVEGYSGTIIVVEVEKIITGKTEARLTKGIEEIQLGIIDRADSLILFVDGICQPFGRNKKGHESHFGKWSYQWENCKNKNPEYDYKLNFRIKVPQKLNLVLSTINDGNISVQKVTGQVNANNINGGITFTGLTQAARAHTINGDVDIQYEQNPKADCRFYTLNGNINAHFKKGLSSDVTFKTFNGEFFSNLEKLVALPIKVEKSSDTKGIKYKVNSNRYQAGSGGALLDFETFNGNVYLKEQ